MSKEIEVVIVSYQQFTDYEFIAPGSYYNMSASQLYYFYKTSDRKKAQEVCDSLFSKGMYSVIPSKIANKSAFKSESGEVTCRGTSTRRGQKK